MVAGLCAPTAVEWRISRVAKGVIADADAVSDQGLPADMVPAERRGPRIVGRRDPASVHGFEPPAGKRRFRVVAKRRIGGGRDQNGTVERILRQYRPRHREDPRFPGTSPAIRRIHRIDRICITATGRIERTAGASSSGASAYDAMVA